MEGIVFFGAGQKGKKMLELWSQFGLYPDFFADNSEALWETFYYGIKVLNPKELKNKRDIKIFITCNQKEDILIQLEQDGIDKTNIFCENVWSADLMPFWIQHMQGRGRWKIAAIEEGMKEQKKCSVLFDLQCGFVLGGVEEWSCQMAEFLKRKKKHVKYITTDSSENIERSDKTSVVLMKYQKDLSESDREKGFLQEIAQEMPCNIVCNFAGDIFRTACMAKTLWPEQVNLIAVVHNDEEVYYERYSMFQNAIDYCLVTCDQMENNFMKRGMARDKIFRLNWVIPCKEQLIRSYSKAGQPIRIGYAGRIIVEQKRMDLLAEIVEKLKEKKVNFRMEIAGKGVYEANLKKQMREYSDDVHFLGCLPREKISDFWEKQDICINCSDFEGRCISKAEAMASGAVPVITDTSSSKDDVREGYNGYVVPVGDTDGIVNCICYLYEHRELLERMGMRSYEIIRAQNQESNLENMWDKLLKFKED